MNFDQILNRTEILKCSKQYKYYRQKGIGEKPTLVEGEQELKTFPLKIKLHKSFCNPSEILQDIEKRAEAREVINYFQCGEYIGDYVIERFCKNIIQTINGEIICAEVEIDLLEKPNLIKNFLKQAWKTPLVTATVFSALKLKSFLKTSSQQALNNSYKITTNVSNLSLPAQNTFNQLNSQVVSGIRTNGISSANNIIKKTTQNLKANALLTTDEVKIIKRELEKIPTKIINASLRKI